MISRIVLFFLVAIGAMGAFSAFRLLEASIAADVYRARIAELSDDYESLLQQYNQAVRRTAVTELRVEDGALKVVIRTAQGDLQELDTPFDPGREIYVDYVVHDGRLWIRRLFDEQTPPGEGLVVDPRFVDVDWNLEDASHGKATYRELGEGSWVVDVTGDGSLGLARRDESEPLRLSPPPPVRDFIPVEHDVQHRMGEVRFGEALEVLARQMQGGA